jgi:hypothetical protein
MSRAHDRLLAILLLCPSCLEAPEEPAFDEESESSEDGGSSEEDGSSGEIDAPFADDLIDPSVSEAQDVHRSRLTMGSGFACAILGTGIARLG